MEIVKAAMAGTLESSDAQATACEHVVTVTTPGDCVDVLVTDYGIAVNPLRPGLIKCLDKAIRESGQVIHY